MLAIFMILALATTSHAAHFVVGSGGAFSTIQAAVDAAAANPGPDTIVLTDGEYHENVRIDDPGRVHIIGSPRVVVRSPDPNFPVFDLYQGFVILSRMLVINGSEGIRGGESGGNLRVWLFSMNVEGNHDRGVDIDGVQDVMIIGGQYEKNIESDGIRVKFADRVVISHTDVTENGSDGIDLENIGTIQLVKVRTRFNGDEGVEVDDSGSFNAWQVYSEGNGDDGIDVDTTFDIVINSSTSVRNGNFPIGDGNGLQIEADDAAFPVNRVIVRNSLFMNNAENGVAIVGGMGNIVARVGLLHDGAFGNQLRGFDIRTGDVFSALGIRSFGNGLPDMFP
jgi:hypothetical protein